MSLVLVHIQPLPACRPHQVETMTENLSVRFELDHSPGMQPLPSERNQVHKEVA